MLIEESEWNALSHLVLGCCLTIHRKLGPGLLESVYADCLASEMRRRKLNFVREFAVPVHYEGEVVGEPLRLDFLIEDTVVLEVKAVEVLHRVHSSQVLTYLKLIGRPLGLLVNFNVALLREGIRRLILTR